jgi:hypothetical protein
MKTLILTSFLVLLFACSQPVAAQASLTSPTRAANKFYRTYLKLKIRGLPNDKQMKVLSPLITRDLKELFESARSSQTRFIQEHPDEKPPWTDGDLFTSLFEGAQSFRLGRPIVRGDRTEVPVQLVYHEGGSSTRWSDVLVLVRTRNRWLVWDILLKGEWSFKSGASLRAVLTSE